MSWPYAPIRRFPEEPANPDMVALISLPGKLDEKERNRIMTVMTTYAPGTFCCPGYCSGDAAKAKSFYSALFGWEPKDMSMSDGAKYTLFRLHGEDIAGMYHMADDRKKAGVTPHWNAYLAVDD